MKKSIWVIMMLVISVIACKKSTENSTNLNVEVPLLGQQAADYSTRGSAKHLPFQLQQINPYSNEVIELGRVLFYDKKLSVNQAISCASCHKQELGFSDGLKSSKGFGNEGTPRNSMAIVNSDFGRGLFWDLREFDIKSMVTKPVQNHIEMGFDSINQTIESLQKTDYYPALFNRAFGSTHITVEKLSEALGGFVSSIISYSSPYDFAAENNFVTYTSEQLRGWELFNQKACINCHGFDLNNSWSISIANIGLDMVYKDKGNTNWGRNGGILIDPFEKFNNNGEGFFKVPSLRNIELTAPYMHDGRFATLEQVVEHYNSGIKDHPDLDWTLRDQATDFSVVKAKKMNMTNSDKKALVAFLKTLTDPKFLADKRFSNPFVAKVN